MFFAKNILLHLDVFEACGFGTGIKRVIECQFSKDEAEVLACPEVFFYPSNDSICQPKQFSLKSPYTESLIYPLTFNLQERFSRFE